MNKAKIEAATTARELAEQQLVAEQKKFELGASTIRFVLEEQRNVAQAQTDELQSLVNYTKSLVDLDHSTGDKHTDCVRRSARSGEEGDEDPTGRSPI